MVERVRAALATLTARERQVMILHYLEGRDCEEIAGRVKITNASVRRILHYSRHKVRTEVQTMQHAETMKHGPRRLTTWINGSMGGVRGRPTVFDYLQWSLAQSICLSANKQTKSVPQIAEQVGAEAAYVEEMATRLGELEVLVSPKPGQYRANFIAFDVEDWKRLTALARQPAAAAAQRLAAAEPRLRAAFEKTSLAASGWSWEDVKWPMYALLLCNRGFQRALPPEHRPPWPERPDGGRYWLGGHEETPDLTPMWMTGFNYSGGGPLPHGYFWSPGLARLDPSYLSPDQALVARSLAGGLRSEADVLAELGDDPERSAPARWPNSLTELWRPAPTGPTGLRCRSFAAGQRPAARRGRGRYEAHRHRRSPSRPSRTSIRNSTRWDTERSACSMPSGTRGSRVASMGEAVHFLMEQGVLPPAAGPAPRNFCFIAWEAGIPLME